MGYYSDPTAIKALGGINREFARLGKKTKHLRQWLHNKLHPAKTPLH